MTYQNFKDTTNTTENNMNPLKTVTGTLVSGLILAIIFTFMLGGGQGINGLQIVVWIHAFVGIIWIGAIWGMLGITGAATFGVMLGTASSGPRSPTTAA